MRQEQISRIWVNEANLLCIQPRTQKFEFIYRSAMNVYWNEAGRYLYNRIVGSWSPVDWLRQIISAVEIEYGYHLFITEDTKWENIDDSIKQSITQVRF